MEQEKRHLKNRKTSKFVESSSLQCAFKVITARNIHKSTNLILSVTYTQNESASKYGNSPSRAHIDSTLYYNALSM